MKLIRLILILNLFLINFNLFAQTKKKNSILFLDCDSLRNDIIKNGKKSKYYHIIEDNILYYFDKPINDYVYIDTNIRVKTIKEIFEKFDNLKLLFKNETKPFRLQKEIYTRNDSIAVFSIYTSNWYFTYRLILKKNLIQVDNLSGMY